MLISIKPNRNITTQEIANALDRSSRTFIAGCG